LATKVTITGSVVASFGGMIPIFVLMLTTSIWSKIMETNNLSAWATFGTFLWRLVCVPQARDNTYV
ncbi:MAG: hypothetical protein CMH32_01080, partial [Micavibrio sp.]|nr:hypothetical protein [Micavibrio sp.]